MPKINADDVLNIIEGLNLDIDLNKIDVNTNLDDQGVDSLDLTNILFGIEEAYNIKIDDQSIEDGEWLSISKIIRNLNRMLN